VTAGPLGRHAILDGGEVRPEPLDQRHRATLRAACAEDAAIWAIFSVVEPDRERLSR
jgi:hypothetical protein